MKDLDSWIKVLNARRSYEPYGASRQKKMEEALRYLGHSHRLASNVILVTGTTGKSCTCRCLETFGLLSKKRVGVFTSSYLYSPKEMIRIQGKTLPEEYLCELFEQTFGIIEKLELNHFEWLMFLVLWVFKNASLDLVILEVELGGSHAAIDWIDADVSVITSIDYDHLEILGETREEIAEKKSAILREGRSAVIAELDPPKALKEKIKALSVKAKWIGKDWSYQLHKNMRATMKTLYLDRVEVIDKKLPMLSIAAATVTWELLYKAVPKEILKEWIRSCDLPGRFQVMFGEPPIVLDVASNPKSVRYLFHRLREFEERHDLRGWNVICSVGAATLWEESLMPWTLEEEYRWYFPKINDALEAKTLRKIFLQERSLIFDTPNQALHQARLDACIRGAGVVIFGGEEILRAFQKVLYLEWDLKRKALENFSQGYPSNCYHSLV